MILPVLLLAFLNCKESKAGSAGSLTVPSLPENYTQLDLSKTGLKATIMTPVEASAEKSTLSDNEGTRPYFIVRPFAIPSDAANPARTIQAKLDIYTTKRPLQQHRDEIKFRPTIGWKSWLKDEADLLIFTARPGNSMGQPIREKDAEVYHFLILRKGAKDGNDYIIATSSSMDYTKDEMLKLLAIARSLNI